MGNAMNDDFLEYAILGVLSFLTLLTAAGLWQVCVP